MDNLSHSDLFMRRIYGDRLDNQLLAPFEHQAFAREWTRENPLLAVPSLGVGIPLYQILKSLNILPQDQNTTPPSLDQLFAGYRGMFQGLK